MVRTFQLNSAARSVNVMKNLVPKKNHSNFKVFEVMHLKKMIYNQPTNSTRLIILFNDNIVDKHPCIIDPTLGKPGSIFDSNPPVPASKVHQIQHFAK